MEPDEDSASGVDLGEGAALHRRSLVLVLAAVGVGALLAWGVSRARCRAPGRPPDYATGTTGAPDEPVPPPTGLEGNALAGTTDWGPAPPELRGFGPPGGDT